MAIFNEKQIKDQFKSNFAAAKTCLANLEFCGSDKPSFHGLSGWVFEKTITYFLRQELKALKIQAEICEQESLGGRAKADFLVGTMAVEVKASGLFHKSASRRYGKYRAAAERKGYSYLYVTLQESYRPYREAMQIQLGTENAFFLDILDEWSRLVNRIAQGLKGDGQGVEILVEEPSRER